MKFRFLLALCISFGFASVFAAEVTRSVELSADQTSALFAVPNGFSFTRAYAYDANGNAVAVTVGEPTTMNHVNLIPVALTDYSPLPTTYSLTAIFEDNGSLFTGYPSRVMREAIREMVANPDDVALVKQSANTRLKFAAADERVDYLILSPSAFVELWNQFREARAEAHPELSFAVQNLDEVYADTRYAVNPDATDGQSRNHAESIHKFLRDYVPAHGVSYVILGGAWINAQSLNENGAWVRNNRVITTLDGNEMALTNSVPGLITFPRNADEEIPSDMFYACLDLKDGQTYPWCKGDSTRYYESFNNAADRLEYDSGVDIVVARIPLKPLRFTIPEGARILDKHSSTMRVGEEHTFTPAEIMDYLIEKLRRGESADFRGIGRLGLSWGDFNYMKRPLDGSLPQEYEFYDDIPNFFDLDRQTDFYSNILPTHRRRIKTIVAPNYPVREVDARCEHNTQWSRGYESTSAAQRNFLATDHDMNIVEMHGWAGGSAWYHVEDCYNQTGIILLNEMSHPCETGYPDFINGNTYVSQVCCGEATVLVPFGGSLASFNNTRYGWAGGDEQFSDRHNVNSYRSFFAQRKNVGQTWLYSHLEFAGISVEAASSGFATSNTGGTGAWVLAEHILYGDPLVRTQAFKGYDTVQSSFPQVATNVVFDAEVVVPSGTHAVVNATTEGDISFSGTGRMKILKELRVAGSSVTINDGVDGGIAKIVFTGAPGTVTINSTKRFYLGGVSNCAEIVVNGSGAIIDCDHFDTKPSSISFKMQDGASNILRGTTTGALASVPVSANGGTLVFESHDLLGGTTVNLEGTVIKFGGDPTVGALAANCEPLNAIFTGSGIIENQHGTMLLRKWNIAGDIEVKDVGELSIGFEYSGALGANPTGWCSSWAGENFDDSEAYLAPNGFVHIVKDGKHPHFTLPAKKGFTLALYANLVKVENSQAVLLSYGTRTSADRQILLVKDSEKIQLQLTGIYGRAADATIEAAYPGAGYHLYVIERVGDELSLKIDGNAKQTITRKFTLSSGFQLGSQFGGLRNNRNKAIGMAVGGVRGYDAILSEEEMAALVAEFPAMGPPLTIDSDVDLNVSGVEARLINATITDGHYLGGSNGHLVIPDSVTVNVRGFKLNNTARSADIITNDVYGVLNVTGTSILGPYEDMRDPATMAGIMLGHYAGNCYFNIFTGGLVDASNGELLIGYTAHSELNINGGTLKVKSLTNYTRTRRMRKDGCTLSITNGGTLEIGDWPCQNQTQPGTMPITIDGGMIKATADWTCPWPMTIGANGATIDANGHKIVFLGAMTGTGKITIIDSSEGKNGSVLFSGDLSAYDNTIAVGTQLAAFGVRAGSEAKVDLVNSTLPSKLMVALSSSQLNSDYDASAFSTQVQNGTTIVFTDYSGYDYQSIPSTTHYTQWSPMDYVYDGITWGEVYCPYDRGVWESLINWREFKQKVVNEETHTMSIQKYSSGVAPQNGGRYENAIILNGDEFEGEKGADGFHDVVASALDGWNFRLGLYNGVHLTINHLNKFQQGNNIGQWVRVDDKSRLTIDSIGGGTNVQDVDFVIGAPQGLEFDEITYGHNPVYNYYLGAGATINFKRGAHFAQHKIREAHASLSDPNENTEIGISMIQIADFNNRGTSRIWTAENGALKLTNADGTVGPTSSYFKNSLLALNDAKTHGVNGQFTLISGDAGLYLAYVDYVETAPKVITITGQQTDLDLAMIPEGAKVRIVGAWGYLKSANDTIENEVEFVNNLSGLGAGRWENGYSSTYTVFNHATGSGTIMYEGGRATSQMMVFNDADKNCDFDGSVIFTNGYNRVVFGAAPASIASDTNPSIRVESGYTANLKDGGIWAVGGLQSGAITINGTLNCKGKADIICMPGITGVENITPAAGYEKYELTLSNNDGTNSRTCRVFVHAADSVPQAEGQLGLGVTDKMITLPSFDMGAYALKIYAGIVRVGADAAVRAPTVEVLGGSFVAAAKVGDTYYGSLEAAVRATGDDVITLLDDVNDFILYNGKTINVNLNGHTLNFLEGIVIQATPCEGYTSYLSTTSLCDLRYIIDGEADMTIVPRAFAQENLPLTLPKPTKTNKVFHGWYMTYENDEYSDGPHAVLDEVSAELDGLDLYGYFIDAIATVDGVPYDNWPDAIAAHNRHGYSIIVLGEQDAPEGYMIENSRLVKIAAMIGDTPYSSFTAARNAYQPDEVIVLTMSSTTALRVGADEVISVRKGEYTLNADAADLENYILDTVEADGVTTYSVHHRDVIVSAPTTPEGVTVTLSTNNVVLVANEVGDYIVHHNAEVTLTYEVEGPYVLNVVSGETVTIDRDIASTDWSEIVKTHAVAQVGSTYYRTLDEAKKACAGGCKLTIVGDITDLNDFGNTALYGEATEIEIAAGVIAKGYFPKSTTIPLTINGTFEIVNGYTGSGVQTVIPSLAGTGKIIKSWGNNPVIIVEDSSDWQPSEPTPEYIILLDTYATNSLSLKTGTRTANKDSAIPKNIEAVGGFSVIGYFWNNTPVHNNNNAVQATSMTLKDGNGTNTSVKVTFRAANTYFNSSCGTATGNARLTSTYFDDAGIAGANTWTVGDITLPAAPCARGWQVKIGNIPYKSYDVYLYVASDVGTLESSALKSPALALSVNDGASWKWYAGDPERQTTIAAAMTDTWKANPYSDGTLTEGVNYLKIRVSRASFKTDDLSTLEITHGPRNTGSSVRSGLAGIQIVEVEDDGDYTRVASVDGVEYGTLAEAIANLGDGDTIELIGDIENETIKLTKDTILKISDDRIVNASFFGAYSLTANLVRGASLTAPAGRFTAVTTDLDHGYVEATTADGYTTYRVAEFRQAKVISINFNGGSETDEKWMSGDEFDFTFAGKVPRSSWINTTGGSGSNIAVDRCWDISTRKEQAITGMTISYDAQGTYGPKVTATLPFMKGYLDLANYAGGKQSVNLDLVGIPFKKCDLIIYFQADSGNGFRPVEVTHNYGATTATYGDDPWGQGNRTDISYEKNVMRINGLVGSVLHVMTLPSTTYRTSVAAVQIIDSTEGIVTYRRNPATTSNDWMSEDGWLLPDGSATTWKNPDLASGEIYTAEIDADRVGEIMLSSHVSVSSVVVKNSAEAYAEGEHSFKFLTSESLSTLLEDNPDAPILNAPVDATGFCGDLYLQSRINGKVSLGANTRITFVAMNEGEETTAYPYGFAGAIQPIRKIGPGSFLVPSSMYDVPFNVTEGSIRYDYSGETSAEVTGIISGDGKLVKSGAGELVFSARNTFVGGTTIEEGIVKLNSTQALGNQRAAVCVKCDGVLDVNGRENHAANLTLDGGTLRDSSTNGGNLGQVQFLGISLEDDSSLDLTGRTGILSFHWSSAELNLNGHTLTKRGSGEFLVCNTLATAGTLRMEEGGLHSSGSNATYESGRSDLSAVDLVIAGENITFKGFDEMIFKSLTIKEGGSIAVVDEADYPTRLSFTNGITIECASAPEDGATIAAATALAPTEDIKISVNGVVDPLLSGRIEEGEIKVVVAQGVARIGERYFATLDAAKAECTADDTLVIIADLTGLSQFAKASDYGNVGAIEIAEGVTVTCYLPDTAATIPLTINGTLKIIDGYSGANRAATIPSLSGSGKIVDGIDANGKWARPVIKVTEFDDWTGEVVYPEENRKLTVEFNLRNRMLYCLHLEGDATNSGIMGQTGITINGTPTWDTTTACQFGSQSMKADNNASYKIANENGICKFEEDWTISFWLNVNGEGSWNDACGFKMGDNIYKLEKKGGGGLTFYQGTTGGLNADIPNKAGWRHFAIRHEQSVPGFTVFVDGSLHEVAYPAATGDLTEVIIGVNGLTQGRNSNMLIDEVAVFSAALSRQQIVWLTENAPSEEVLTTTDLPTAEELVRGKACLYDWTFTNTLASVGIYTNSLNWDTGYNANNGFVVDDAFVYGAALKTVATPYSDFYVEYPNEWTCLIAGVVPNVDHGSLITFGNYSGGSIALVSTNATHVLLVRTTGNSKYAVLADMEVPFAREASHTYGFVKTASSISVYLDGKKWNETTVANATISHSLQVGSIHGGENATGIKSSKSATNATSIQAVRIISGALEPEFIEAFAREFPYVSNSGRSERTVSAANETWEQSDAWTITSASGISTAALPLEGSQVIIHTTADVTTTMLAELSASVSFESLTIDGEGAIAFVCNEENVATKTINPVSSSIEAPIKINLGILNLASGPLDISARGHVTFDFTSLTEAALANSDFSEKVTGVTSGSIENFTLTKAEFEHYELSLVYEAEEQCYYVVGHSTITWATVELPSALGTSVDRTKLEAWATKNGVTLETVSSIKPSAFALNCANTDAAIEAEEEDFKVSISIGADGEVIVTLPEGKTYNIAPVIQGCEKLGDEWHEKRDGDKFFRAVIELNDDVKITI